MARTAVSDPSQTPTGIDYGGGGSEPRKPLQNWMATSELTDKDAHLYRSIDEKTKFPGGSWTLRPDWLQKLRCMQDFKVNRRPKTYTPSLARDIATTMRRASRR